MTGERWDDDAALRRYLGGAGGAGEARRIEAALAGGDAALEARLQALDPLRPQMEGAAAALLAAAPADRLAGLLQAAVAQRAPVRRLRVLRLAAAAAVLLAALGAGLWWQAGRFAPAGQQVAEAPAATAQPAWTTVVAGYVRLFSAETFRAAPMTGDQLAAALQAGATATGRDLAAIVAGLPDWRLARVELLALDGRPLVQLSFLDPAERVVTVCVLARTAAQNPAPARRLAAEGMEIVAWAEGLHGVMVIGRLPAAEVLALSARLGAPV
jgi:hypothetical protein